MIVWLVAVAWAGYGDPIGGRPTHEERDVHAWSNAVRVDPEAFTALYPCAISSFHASERTPKAPLRHDPSLGAVALSHSDDMRVHNFFDHTSSDGTPAGERIAAGYGDRFVGENIAYGYPPGFEVVVEGWMCSPGHRAGIMMSAFTEMGVGVSGLYTTQNFGALADVGMAMGVHRPKAPVGVVDFAVDWARASAPAVIAVVLDGAPIPLVHQLGDPAGWSVWGIDDLPVAPGCHTYFFEAEHAGAFERFPEEGSFTFGGCADDDPVAGWVATQDAPAEPDEPVVGGPTEGPPEAGSGGSSCGSANASCATTPAGLGALWLSPMWLLARRRRLRG